MLFPLVGGVGPIFGLLVLPRGGGLITFLPVGGFLLWFMGDFLLMPLISLGGLSLDRRQRPSYGVPLPSLLVTLGPVCHPSFMAGVLPLPSMVTLPMRLHW